MSAHSSRPGSKEPGDSPSDNGAPLDASDEQEDDWLPGGRGQEEADYFPDLSKAKRMRPQQIRAASVLSNSQFLKTALQLRGNAASGALGGSAAETLTPLLAACQAGSFKNVKMLTQIDDPAAGGQGSEAALLYAVDSGSSEVVSFLLSVGRGNVNARNSAGCTPFLLAAKDRRLEIIQLLCKSPKLNPDAQDKFGMTALHQAVAAGSLPMVETILGRGANPGLTNEKGWTPLHIAANLGHIPIIEALVRHGTSLNAPAQAPDVAAAEVAAAALAAAAGDVSQEEAVVEPARPIVFTAWAPLHLAILRGHVEAVHKMLDLDADPTAPGVNSVTPLMLAVKQAHHELVGTLLGLGQVREGLDQQDDHGWTAAHYAADNNDPRSIRRLLNAGGDPSLRSRQGVTALDVSKSLHFGLCDLARDQTAPGVAPQVEVAQLLEIEEIVRLVMMRTKCRQDKKYEEAELLRGELRVRGVRIDVQNDRWSLPDGKWGYLSAERSHAQVQQNNPIRASTMQGFD